MYLEIMDIFYKCEPIIEYIILKMIQIFHNISGIIKNKELSNTYI